MAEEQANLQSLGTDLGTDLSSLLGSGSGEVSQIQEGAEKKATESFTDKVDPSKLPPELQNIYKSMQADYTRKTQKLAEERRAYERQLQELREALKSYESVLPYYVQGAQAQQQQPAPSWDPFDENAVKSYFTHYLSQYANQYLDQVRNWMQWQWYVTSEAMRLSRMYPDFNLNDVLRYAPHYNFNLEMTAKALYESPRAYEAAKKASEYEKELQQLRAELEQLKRRANQSPYIAAGPSRPLRPANGQQTPSTIQEIAASIPVEQVLLRE